MEKFALTNSKWSSNTKWIFRILIFFGVQLRKIHQLSIKNTCADWLSGRKDIAIWMWAHDKSCHKKLKYIQYMHKHMCVLSYIAHWAKQIFFSRLNWTHISNGSCGLFTWNAKWKKTTSCWFTLCDEWIVIVIIIVVVVSVGGGSGGAE